MVGFGPKPPDGMLSAYSVADEREAKQLIVLTCQMNQDGDYFAPELAEHQTLENLGRFSDRLDRGHEILKRHGQCRCGAIEPGKDRRRAIAKT